MGVGGEEVLVEVKEEEKGEREGIHISEKLRFVVINRLRGCL